MADNLPGYRCAQCGQATNVQGRHLGTGLVACAPPADPDITPAGLAARFAEETGIQAVMTTGGNAVLAPQDATALLDLAQGFQPVPAGNEWTCPRCGGGFQAGSRAWGIVWDGEQYWLQVRYVITMPLGPYHTGCIGATLNERNGYGQPSGPAAEIPDEPAKLRKEIIFWLTARAQLGLGLTTRQLAQQTGRPEPDVLLALDAMTAGHLVRARPGRWVTWFLTLDQETDATP